RPHGGARSGNPPARALGLLRRACSSIVASADHEAAVFAFLCRLAGRQAPPNATSRAAPAGGGPVSALLRSSLGIQHFFCASGLGTSARERGLSGPARSRAAISLTCNPFH